MFEKYETTGFATINKIGREGKDRSPVDNKDRNGWKVFRVA
jgi:hypothetical protein